MTTESAQSQQTWHPPPEGSPCWVEIPAKNIEKLKEDSISNWRKAKLASPGKEFYAVLFPSWEWRPSLGESTHDESQVQLYHFAEPKGLGGGILKMPQGCAPTEQAMGTGTTVYYMVDSLEKIEMRVHELGGATCLGKTEESSNGWFMNFRDPEGNRFGCYQMRDS